MIIPFSLNVTQSQANKNYWAAFVIWQKQVADAMARIREEELARKRAKPPQQPKPSKSQLLALLIGITVLFAVLSLIPPSPPKPPYGQPEHPKTGELVNQNIGDGCSGVMTICNYGGGGGGGGGVIILFDLFYKVATNFVSGSLSILTQFVKQVAVQSVMDAIQDAIVDEILEQELEQDDDDDDIIYYFRGTTDGYLGGEHTIALGITSTTTQPGVATVFATVAETTYGGEGVVYIFSANSLANIQPEGENVLGSLEFELGFNILPNELEELAMLKITARQARTILATMGFRPIDSRIMSDYLNTALRDLIPLTKAQISHFVNLAIGMGSLP